MDALIQDLRYALRGLRRSPSFTAIVLLTLALGIGANAAIFSFVYAVLFRPLPYSHADRLVSLWERRPDGGRNGMTTLNYLDYASTPVFEHVATITGCCGAVMLTEGDATIELDAAHVSASYFDVFGAKAERGRTFRSGEDQPGHDHVVVLSHSLWATRFGADPTLVGRSIRLNAEPYTVIGILPADTPFDRSFEMSNVWLPLSIPAERMKRSGHWLLGLHGAAVGLLKPDVTVEQARAQLEAVSARIAKDYPDTNKGWGIVVERYRDVLVEKTLRQSLYLLFAAVLSVLLIACVNLVNVLLARSVAREREVAIRQALGAGRGRLIQQLLTESMLLSTTGGMLGLALGYVMMRLLKAAWLGLPLTQSVLPVLVPAEADIRFHTPVLIFTLIASLLCGLACGLAPAIEGTRIMNASLYRRTTAARGHRRVRRGLIVAEISLAFVLLTSAALLTRSLVNMQQADTGFIGTNVLTARLPVWEHRFVNGAQLRAHVERVVAAIRALPGVRDVALTNAFPFSGAPTRQFFQIVGRPTVERAERPLCFFKVVSPAYFRVLALHVLRGRALDDHDRADGPAVVVINETMARLYFANQNPVGQHLLLQQIRPGTTEEISWEIVGIIANERLMPFENSIDESAAYVPTDQTAAAAGDLVVGTTKAPMGLAETIRKTVAAVDAEQGLTEIKTIDQLTSDSMAPDRLRDWLIGGFAALAALLAAIGLYGVISYAVSQQTREIGVRIALGAERSRIVRLIVADSVVLTVIGIALGVVSAVVLTRHLRSLLFGVQPVDALTFVAIGILFGLVAMVAAYLPARRAARVDPMVALRAE
jgi:putative ABC transport system permease protein